MNFQNLPITADNVPAPPVSVLSELEVLPAPQPRLVSEARPPAREACVLIILQTPLGPLRVALPYQPIRHLLALLAQLPSPPALAASLKEVDNRANVAAMKTPSLPGPVPAAPIAPPLLRALQLNQTVSARLALQSDAPEGSSARSTHTLVLDTPHGPLRLRLAPEQAPHLKLPSSPRTPAEQASAPPLRLQVLALRPLLTFVVLAEPSPASPRPSAAPNQAPALAPSPPPLPAGTQLVAEPLGAKTLTLDPPKAAREPNAAPTALTLQPKSEAATPAPVSVQSQLTDALRTLTVKQAPQAESLKALLKLLPALQNAALPSAVAGKSAPPLAQILTVLLREALTALPSPARLARGPELRTLLETVLTARLPSAAPPPGAAASTAAPAPSPLPWGRLAEALHIVQHAFSAPSELATEAQLPPLAQRLISLLEPRGRQDADAQPAHGMPSALETELLEQTLKLADSLSCRVQFQQLQNAPAGQTAWLLELPLRQGRELDTVDLRIEQQDLAQEGPEAARQWTVSLQFDFPGLGMIRSVVQCCRGALQTRFFAREPKTVQRINDELAWLSDALLAEGLSATLHPCEQAALTKIAEPKPRGLVDLSV